MASTLDHIEQVLADAYRREIDLDENIWRSLPFFAAALALELTAVYQISGHIPPAGTNAWRISLALTAIAGLAALIALGFLMASIFPVRLSYLVIEPPLLRYVKNSTLTNNTAITPVEEPRSTGWPNSSGRSRTNMRLHATTIGVSIRGANGHVLSRVWRNWSDYWQQSD
jgi:hypothetical protein